MPKRCANHIYIYTGRYNKVLYINALMVPPGVAHSRTHHRDVHALAALYSVSHRPGARCKTALAPRSVCCVAGADQKNLNIKKRIRIYSPICTLEDGKKLQADLLKLVEWWHKWQLPFNQDKCKVIHYGRNNPCFDYLHVR